MSKKTTEQKQKEYDDIIINTERYEDSVNQTANTMKYFEEKLKSLGTTIEDARKEVKKKAKKGKEKERDEIKRILDSYDKALSNNDKAKAEQYAYQKKIEKRLNELKEDKRVKTTNKDGSRRTSSDIDDEKNGKKSASEGFKESLKSKGGGNMILGAANAVMGVLGGAADIYLAEKKKEVNTFIAEQDMYLKAIETSSNIFQRNVKTFAKGMQGALSSSFASITEGVQEGAYSAASNSVSFANDMLINTFDNALDSFKQENYNIIRQAQLELENQGLTLQEVQSGANAVSGVLNMFPGIGSAIGGLISGIADMTAKIVQGVSEQEQRMLEKRIEVSEKEVERYQEAIKTAVEQAGETVGQILNFSRAIENLSLKTDEASKSMANIIGMPGTNVNDFEKYIFNVARNLSFTDSKGNRTYLNKNPEDMMKVQSSYIESTGRSRQMSRKDFVNTFMLGEVIGDDGLAAELLGDMDYFNKSIANGTDMIYNMFQAANKAGVSNRKFAKDLQENLKLAQKYTFKGGVESMMKMSIWAQKTRFNMQSLEGMVDKIQDSGLEGVITQGAKLQVLGGNMAMGADPIAMMYESWADPESLMKRFYDMTKGTGHFNSKTGEVDINGADAMRLKEYANIIGMDYKEARAQVTQRIKGEQIDKQLTANYSDEQKAMLYNAAKLGKDGRWKVTVNGEEKDINDLKDKDWNSLMPIEESINDYVKEIYNLIKSQGGATNKLQADTAEATFENLKENIYERMSENINFAANSSDELKTMVEKSNKFVTDQNEQQHTLMLETTKVLDKQFKLIQNNTVQMINGISDSSSQFNTALDAVVESTTLSAMKIRKEQGDTSITDDMIKAQEERANAFAVKLKNQMKINEDSIAGSQINDGKLDRSKQIASAMDEYMKKIGNYAWRRGKDYLEKKRELGDFTYDNKNDFEGILDRGNFDDELLNFLNDKGIITHNDTEELNKEDFKYVKTAIEYIAKNAKYNENENGYNGWWSFLKPLASVSLNDGIVSGDDGITSIAGTSVVKSDPKDVAIFAKEGGVIGKEFASLREDVNNVMKRGNLKVDDINIHMNGRLELYSGGQSIDIIDTLNNNPIVLRAMTRKIAQEIMTAMNGGKSINDMQNTNTFSGIFG